MKLQTLACAVAIATGGFFFTHVVNEAIAADKLKPAAAAVDSTDTRASLGLASACDFGGPSTLFKSAFRCQIHLIVF